MPAASRALRNSLRSNAYSLVCVDFSIAPIMGACYHAPKLEAHAGGVVMKLISKREIATVLSALEVWKEELAEGQEWIPESIHFKNYSPLSVYEIDKLAERLASESTIASTDSEDRRQGARRTTQKCEFE